MTACTTCHTAMSDYVAACYQAPWWWRRAAATGAVICRACRERAGIGDPHGFGWPYGSARASLVAEYPEVDGNGYEIWRDVFDGRDDRPNAPPLYAVIRRRRHRLPIPGTHYPPVVVYADERLPNAGRYVVRELDAAYAAIA